MNALIKKLNTGAGRRDDKCSFEILGFPCNQFGKQEPGESAEEITNGLEYVRPGNGFKPAFKLFQKGDVNGAKENPMYTHLKGSCPLPGGVVAEKQSSILWSPVRSHDIHWNFEKFLIDHKGNPHKRFLSVVRPMELSQDIEMLMNQCNNDLKQDESSLDYLVDW